MKFCVRVDDVGWAPDLPGSSSGRQIDVGLKLARAFHEALGGAPWLAAVITGALDQGGVRWLREQSKSITIALHGLRHSWPNQTTSEFWHLDRAGCYEVLMRGMDVLGVQVRHLVPPFNTVTEPLLLACEDAGVEVVWTGPRGGFPCPRLRAGVVEVPAEESLYGATDQKVGPTLQPIGPAVAALAEGAGVSCISLHLPWEAATKRPFLGVARLGASIGGRMISPDDYVSSPRQWRAAQ